MKKTKKIKTFFTIDEQIYISFCKIVEDKILDKSKLIEYLIKKYVEEHTNNLENL